MADTNQIKRIEETSPKNSKKRKRKKQKVNTTNTFKIPLLHKKKHIRLKTTKPKNTRPTKTFKIFPLLHKNRRRRTIHYLNHPSKTMTMVRPHNKLMFLYVQTHKRNVMKTIHTNKKKK